MWPGSSILRREQSRGMTLAELLVAIGIIALLFSILLPALASARRAARSAVCLSNLRQINGIAAGWAADHQGFLPLDGEAVLPPGTQGAGSLPNGLNDSRRNRYAYTPFPEDYPHVPPTLEAITPFHVALAQRMLQLQSPWELGTPGRWASTSEPSFPALRLFHCPEVQRHPRETEVPEGTASLYMAVDGVFYDTPWWTTFDYASNGGLLGFHYNQRFAHRRYAGRLTRVSGSSTFVLNGDAGGSGAVWLPARARLGSRVTLQDIWLGSAEVDQDWARATLDVYRHSGRANVSFVDGHAESVPLRGDGQSLARLTLLADD